jgi:plastocyanin
MWRCGIAVAITFLFLGSISSRGATANVQVGDFFFSPFSVNIRPGDTVRWTNATTRTHDTTSKAAPPLWGSGNVLPNGTFSFTFPNLGSFPYQCVQHQQFNQTGTVVVAANVAPTVALNTPANGTTYGRPATFTVTAAASDSDGTVTQVQFFANNTLLGTDLMSVYSVVTSNLLAGSYALTAQAWDNSGAKRTSAPVNITVSQPAGGVTHFVDVSDLAVNPPLLIANVGDTVIWRNVGTSNHTASATGGSPQALCGATIIRDLVECTNRFTAEGSFAYTCSVHANSARGTVIVAQPIFLSSPRVDGQGRFRFDFNTSTGGKYQALRTLSNGTPIPPVLVSSNTATTNMMTVTDTNKPPGAGGYSVRRVF